MMMNMKQQQVKKQTTESVPKKPKVSFNDKPVKVQPPIVKIPTSPPPSAPPKAPEPKKTTENILKQQSEDDLDKELQEELEELNISNQPDKNEMENVEDVVVEEDVVVDEEDNQSLKKN